MYSLIVYRPMTSPYVRFVRVSNGFIYDVAGTESPITAWGSSDTALTPDPTYIGGTPVAIPTALLEGEWDMLIYDSATPAATDPLIIGKRIQWNGTRIEGLPQDL